MDIKYSEKVVKQLKKIRKGDKKSVKIIIDEIERFSNQIDKNFDIKMLKGKYGEFKRLRIGKYRIIFEEINDTIYIYEIKHRQEAYND